MFVQFGTGHIAVILAVLGVSLTSIAAVRVWSSLGLVRTIRWGLAAVLIFTWALWLLLLYEEGWLSTATVLPMHLCDWAAIITVITLILPGQRTYELAYFWASGGTLQALLTPDLAVGFPDPRFAIFFALHGGVIVAVLFLTLGLGMRPWPSSIPRVIAWSLVYLVSAIAVNALFGTNFGFLSTKPSQPSLLDLFGPWPFYIGEMVLTGSGLIGVLYSPFLVLDCLRGRPHTRG